MVKGSPGTAWDGWMDDCEQGRATAPRREKRGEGQDYDRPMAMEKKQNPRLTS